MHRRFIFLLLLPVASLHAGEWKSSPINNQSNRDDAATPKGKIEIQGNALIISGSQGWGAESGLPIGDCTVVLRLTALTGQLLVQVAAKGAAPTSFGIEPRKDGPAISEEQPQYVRLAIQGRNTSYWVSQDGRRWLNRLGGFRVDGDAPLQLRLGLGSKGETNARIEVSIKLGLHLENRTDWFANSLPGSAGDTVNLNMISLAVAADGSCLVTSEFEEQGHCTAIFCAGRQLAPHSKSIKSGRAAAFAGDVAYVAVREGVQRIDRDVQPQGKPVRLITDGMAQKESKKEAKTTGKEQKFAGRGVVGLAADAQEVFASLPDEEAIAVLDATR